MVTKLKEPVKMMKDVFLKIIPQWLFSVGFNMTANVASYTTKLFIFFQDL